MDELMTHAEVAELTGLAAAEQLERLDGFPDGAPEDGEPEDGEPRFVRREVEAWQYRRLRESFEAHWCAAAATLSNADKATDEYAKLHAHFGALIDARDALSSAVELRGDAGSPIAAGRRLSVLERLRGPRKPPSRYVSE